MTVASKLLMGAAGVDTGPSDDEFDNVSFLSHFDGSNNGTNIVFDDGSASNHTLTVTGTPTQGSFSPYARVDGEWSNYFPADSNYLEIASSSDFNFGTGDFTWEWFFFGAPSGSYPVFYSQTGANFGVYYNVSDGKIYYDNDAISDTDMGTLPLNSWNHIAVSRVSGTSNLYLNGTRTATVSDGQDYATGTARVGNYLTGSGSSYPMNGYISNLRIIKGTGLYSATSITVPTSALTAISGTVLLTCQSNRFIDNSASAHALTVGGTPKVTAFTPILTSKVYDSAVNGASAYFDGSGDYLTPATSSDFTFGTGDFTVECWVYFDTVEYTGIWQIDTTPLSGAGYIAPVLEVTPTGAGGAFVWSTLTKHGGDSRKSSSVTPSTNTWYHTAVVRTSGTIKVFVDGTQVISDFTDTTDFTDRDSVVIGGFFSTTYLLNGYLSNFRIVKGTAVYTSNFTPPTAPLTAVTNTVLLLNMADGQMIDSAAQNNMTLRNGAVTSTTQEKFGTASLDLTASDAFVTFPASANSFGSGNFTIEAWVYVTDASSYNCIISLYSSIQFYVNNNTLECYAFPLITSNGSFLGPSSSISNDTWYHVAMVRNGTSLTAYVNGVGGTPVTGSTAALTAYTGTASIGIYNSGASAPNVLSFGGYIDDFRISHFARYTSNFTPSTEAFPDKGQ